MNGTNVTNTTEVISINTELCHDPEIYLISSEEFKLFRTEEWSQKLGRFMIWEGGVAWNVTFFASVLTAVLAITCTVRICALRKKRRQPQDRRNSSNNNNNETAIKANSWKERFLSEDKTGHGGATFLSFQYWLLRAYVMMAFVGVFLTIMHWFSKELRENPKTIRSTALGNIGMVGIHPLLLTAILFWPFIPSLKKHGKDRGLNALPSHEVRNKSTYFNMKWLKIDNVPIEANINRDMIENCLKTSFSIANVKEIMLVEDVSKMAIVVDKHCHEIQVLDVYSENKADSGELMKFSCYELYRKLYRLLIDDTIDYLKRVCIVNILKRQAPEKVPHFEKFTFWQFVKAKMYEFFVWGEYLTTLFKKCFKCETSIEYHTRKEAHYRDKLRRLLKNVSFSGTVLVKFDSEIETREAKMKLRNYILSKDFWGHFKMDNIIRSLVVRVDKIKTRGNFVCTSTPDPELQVHHWNVQYAPKHDKINWKAMKPPNPLWKRLANKVWIITCFILYVVAMSAPGVLLREMKLQGDEANDDRMTLLFKAVFMPTLLNFGTRFLTDILIDWLWDFNKNHTATKDLAKRFWFTFTLEITLYLVRMLAKKPLPIILYNVITNIFGVSNGEVPPVEWHCLFYPVHATFIANAIIVNTASTIIFDMFTMAATPCPRLYVLRKSLNPLYKFHDRAEEVVFIRNLDQSYDVCSNYSEIACNFVLALGFSVIFPLLGPISFFCAVLRVFSNRFVVMYAGKISTSGHHIHRAPVDGVTCLALFGPIALLMYRVIQLKGNINWNDTRVLVRLFCPVAVGVFYGAHVLYCYFARKIKIFTWSLKPAKNTLDPAAQIAEEECLLTNDDDGSQYQYYNKVTEYVAQVHNLSVPSPV